MAVAVQMDFAGGTLAQYDEVIEKMGFTPGGPGAPGGLFHWVAKTEDGLRVVDVWETKEQFERFGEEQIGPITAEVGINPGTFTVYEVHSYLTAG
jgi:hypothetical protein